MKVALDRAFGDSSSYGDLRKPHLIHKTEYKDSPLFLRKTIHNAPNSPQVVPCHQHGLG